MFSGIVEALSPVKSARVVNECGGNLVQIEVERPREFTDIKTGDSIATNGVCLTVEKFDDRTIQFALAAETLQVTGWSAEKLAASNVNLERSLRMGDRIHGHMVSGHVDGVGQVTRAHEDGGSVFLDVQAPAPLLRYVWKKGSWAVNGVSLTINGVSKDGIVGMCLIPETVKRTNLGALKTGDIVNLEVDMMARGMVSFFENAPQMQPQRT
jgi:riboflavin synthase